MNLKKIINALNKAENRKHNKKSIVASNTTKLLNYGSYNSVMLLYTKSLVSRIPLQQRKAFYVNLTPVDVKGSENFLSSYERLSLVIEEDNTSLADIVKEMLNKSKYPNFSWSATRYSYGEIYTSPTVPLSKYTVDKICAFIGKYQYASSDNDISHNDDLNKYFKNHFSNRHRVVVVNVDMNPYEQVMDLVDYVEEGKGLYRLTIKKGFLDKYVVKLMYSDSRCEVAKDVLNIYLKNKGLADHPFVKRFLDKISIQASSILSCLYEIINYPSEVKLYMEFPDKFDLEYDNDLFSIEKVDRVVVYQPHMVELIAFALEQWQPTQHVDTITDYRQLLSFACSDKAYHVIGNEYRFDTKEKYMLSRGIMDSLKQIWLHGKVPFTDEELVHIKQACREELDLAMEIMRKRYEDGLKVEMNTTNYPFLNIDNKVEQILPIELNLIAYLGTAKELMTYMFAMGILTLKNYATLSKYIMMDVKKNFPDEIYTAKISSHPGILSIIKEQDQWVNQH